MVRSYKQPSIVSGLSIQDIVSMDIEQFNKLNVSDMRKVVGRLVSAGNKRLRSFEKSGESSPATRYVERSGGKFSTKGKNLNQLRAEYSRAKGFLESKTSTRSGYKKVKKETVKTLQEKNVDIDSKKLDELFEIYEKLKEMNPEVSAKQLKYSVLTEISNALDDGQTSDDIIFKMHDELAEVYEEEQERLTGGGWGVSGFFEIK